ncbi:hypothetical protein A8E81_32425 [Burkholderia cenocepacia]|nr:hypothetical protein A8E75_34635 [Burkholderia cenocepacia]ONV26878.1 hypothetical protein A8E74_06925 [Burkholderia cenocepacia]ONV29838.1 hypothetical protein A8E77_21935 [Burkholderia cenocepacia]ONV30163.1 hypothetical protein A8E78_18815 [Burkholderia cenocepacia]ONV43490.1 hypothetical protein A8E81_32425 [Burkholderia cenocepacia]
MPPIARSSCPLLTASVLLMPSATLTSRRSWPSEPNDTVLASVAFDPLPSATELVAPDDTVAP